MSNSSKAQVNQDDAVQTALKVLMQSGFGEVSVSSTRCVDPSKMRDNAVFPNGEIVATAAGAQHPSWLAMEVGSRQMFMTPNFFYCGRVVAMNNSNVTADNIVAVFDIREPFETALLTGKFGVAKEFPPATQMTFPAGSLISWVGIAFSAKNQE